MGQQQSGQISEPVPVQRKSMRDHTEHNLSEEVDEYGYLSCSCGYSVRSKHEHALHIECHLPQFKPIHPCGWPSIQLDTVPYVKNTQRGVIARGHLMHSTFTSIHLKNGYSVDNLRKVLANKQLHNLMLDDSFLSDFEGVNIVTVVGASIETWRKVSPHVPLPMMPFTALNDQKGNTIFPGDSEGDLFLFVKGNRADACYEVAALVLKELGEDLESSSMTQGFAYKPNPHGAKDLTGFIDGTRNPDHLLRALVDEVVIFPDDFENASHHTGGTFMYAGKFVHDLPKFNRMNPHAQSEIIGRDITKEEPHHGYDNRLENPRLIPEEETTSSTGYHVARGFGSMYRQAMPFRDSNEEGLYFISFARDLSEIDTALKRMSGHYEEDGSVDKLFEITTAVSSGYYYVPSLQELFELENIEGEIENQIVAAEHKDESVSGDHLKVFVEYCTNCGYKTLFYDNKRILEAAVPGIQVIGNPQMPRLSSFEITTEDGFVLWSKLAQPDGRNNGRSVFPTQEQLLKSLSTYLKLEEPITVDIPAAAIYTDAGTSHGVW